MSTLAFGQDSYHFYNLKDNATFKDFIQTNDSLLLIGKINDQGGWSVPLNKNIIAIADTNGFVQRVKSIYFANGDHLDFRKIINIDNSTNAIILSQSYNFNTAISKTILIKVTANGNIIDAIEFNNFSNQPSDLIQIKNNELLLALSDSSANTNLLLIDTNLVTSHRRKIKINYSNLGSSNFSIGIHKLKKISTNKIAICGNAAGNYANFIGNRSYMFVLLVDNNLNEIKRNVLWQDSNINNTLNYESRHTMTDLSEGNNGDYCFTSSWATFSGALDSYGITYQMGYLDSNLQFKNIVSYFKGFEGSIIKQENDNTFQLAVNGRYSNSFANYYASPKIINIDSSLNITKEKSFGIDSNAWTNQFVANKIKEINSRILLAGNHSTFGDIVITDTNLNNSCLVKYDTISTHSTLPLFNIASNISIDTLPFQSSTVSLIDSVENFSKCNCGDTLQINFSVATNGNIVTVTPVITDTIFSYRWFTYKNTGYYLIAQGVGNPTSFNLPIYNLNQNEIYLEVNGKCQSKFFSKMVSIANNNQCLYYDTIAACPTDSVIFPDGVKDLAQNSNNHVSYFNLPNAACDSLIITFINFFSTSFNQTALYSCLGQQVTFPDGSIDSITNSNAIYKHYQNANGCDSLVAYNPILIHQYDSIISAFCYGDYVITSTSDTIENLYSHYVDTITFITNYGCDSFLRIHYFPQSQVIHQDVYTNWGCPYTFPNGFTATNYPLQSYYNYSYSTNHVPGCDTLFTFTLGPAYNTTTINACLNSVITYPDGFVDSITSFVNPSHIALFPISGGCDSVVIYQVNVVPGTAVTNFVTINACLGDTIQVNGINYTNSTTIQNFYTLAFGTCDSIVSTTINFHPSFNVTINYAICSNSNFSCIDGTLLNNLVADTMYTNHFFSSTGCDSIIKQNIIVNPNYTIAIFDTICGSLWILPNGNTFTINNDTIINIPLTSISGCDSILQFNIHPISFPTSTTVIDTVCFGATYQLPNGIFIPAIKDTIMPITVINQAGCDSNILNYLYVISIDTSITQIGDTLSSNQANANYQWYNCSTGMASINDTLQNFKIMDTMTYACIITYQNCTDTSGCYYGKNITSIGTTTYADKIHIWPNPTSDRLNIQYQLSENGTYKIFDKLGKIINSGQLQSKTINQINLNSSSPGIYTISIEGSDRKYHYKIIKE